MDVKKIKWNDEEIVFLKENYLKIGPKYCSEKLNRPYSTIIKKASRLNLKTEPKWSDNDILFLKENYINLGAKYCSNQLNKSIESIYFKVSKLQLSEKRTMWCENDINYLKKNFLMGVNHCSEVLNKTPNSIRNKINDLSLTKQNLWSETEDTFLSENYSKLGIDECCKILNRSVKSIKNRCNKLKLKIITNNELINKFNLKHYSLYNYTLVNYVNSKTKIKIICPQHDIFEQLPYEHLRGKGCPICRESKGEKEIRNILLNKNINFISQYKFNDCKNIKTLPFDFYLPDLNTCIEFQGEQHYKPINWFGGIPVFNQLIKRDKIKEKYCLKNEIKLLIIPYNKDIKSIINKSL